MSRLLKLGKTAIVAVCGCKTHYTRAGWLKLSPVGALVLDDGSTMESRLCDCGSTVSIRGAAQARSKETRRGA